MKKIAMLLCFLIVCVGFYQVIVKSNIDGVVVMIIGTFAFLTLATGKAKSHNTFTEIK